MKVFILIITVVISVESQGIDSGLTSRKWCRLAMSFVEIICPPGANQGTIIWPLSPRYGTPIEKSTTEATTTPSLRLLNIYPVPLKQPLQNRIIDFVGLPPWLRRKTSTTRKPCSRKTLNNRYQPIQVSTNPSPKALKTTPIPEIFTTWIRSNNPPFTVAVRASRPKKRYDMPQCIRQCLKMK